MMAALMPSPIGHALAGVAVAWGADLVPRTIVPGAAARGVAPRTPPTMVALFAGLAMLPDADLLVPGTHRMATHSLAAAGLVFIVAMAVTGRVTRLRASRLRASRFGAASPRRASRFNAAGSWRTPLLCSLAYASHLLLDWLGADMVPPRGIQLLWPFSQAWFISDLDVFRQTARREFLTAPIIRQNVVAVAQELAILLPILVLLWWMGERARARAVQW
jgi:membrane-bound metal-dependent hydrolase YbcI (DUF457 family)